MKLYIQDVQEIDDAIRKLTELREDEALLEVLDGGEYHATGYLEITSARGFGVWWPRKVDRTIMTGSPTFIATLIAELRKNTQRLRAELRKKEIA